MIETHNIFLLLVIVKMTMTPIKKIKITMYIHNLKLQKLLNLIF